MIKTDIEQLIQPVIANLGFNLWGFEFLAQGKYSILRVYIDKEEGITISDCSMVSKQVNAILEVEGVITGNYNLEVSSPGVPRPLFIKEHYLRYLGSEIELKLNKPINERRKLKGIIRAVEENVLQLTVEDELVDIPFPQIVKANLIGE